MKKQILKAIGVASLTILMMTTFAQIGVSAQDNDKVLFQKGNERSLAGSWDVQVTIRDCQTGDPIPFIPTFPVMRTYNRGGTMQEVGADRVFQPGHGVWKHTAGQTFYHSFRFFRFNADGTLAGTGKVVGNVEVAQRGSAFSANTTFQILDLDGNVQGSGCATETATRFE